MDFSSDEFTRVVVSEYHPPDTISALTYYTK